MITFEEATAIVLTKAQLLETESVDLLYSTGRVLAEDVVSDVDMPPFDKSAMDGFACKKADLDQPLKILETIAAGSIPTREVGSGECSRIMTGAMIPKGADCVVMVEHTELLNDSTVNIIVHGNSVNICYKGEDIKEHDQIFFKGTLITPSHVPMLASVGCSRPKVIRKATVGVLSTGDELVEPALQPGISQIRNSNGYQLASQVMNCNAEASYLGIVKDSEQATYDAIKTAIENHDIVLLTGGVSMGEFDFVPKIMDQIGIEILFRSVAVQPGRPMTFGCFGKKYIFALPGNPVSSFVQFEMMVKPMIYKLMGHTYTPKPIRMPMEHDFKRRKPDRLAWVPVRLTEKGTVESVDYHGSAHIYSISQADGFIAIPIGVQTVSKGEFVDVRSI